MFKVIALLLIGVATSLGQRNLALEFENGEAILLDRYKFLVSIQVSLLSSVLPSSSIY